MLLGLRVRPLVMFLVFASASFVGCVDTGAPAEPRTQPDEPGPVVAETTQDLGAIEGVVVDDAISPIPNASASLEESSTKPVVLANATSDQAGAFAFSRLEPATYRVRVNAIGYAEWTGLVQVRAGDVTKVVAAMGSVPSAEPYLLLFIKTDEISCRFAAIVVVSTGRCEGAGSSGQTYSIPDGFQLIISETTWSNKQEYLLHQFMARNQTTATGGTGEVAVRNSVARPIHRAELWPGVKDATFTTVILIPVPKTKFDLRVYTLYAGQYADEIDAYARPACITYAGRCNGVGVTLQTRFTQFMSVFVNGLPPDWKSYSAVPDA